MATILIDPVKVKSRGGHSVTIKGISPTQHDCIDGEITGAAGTIKGSWNLSGIRRGGQDGENLDMNTPPMSDIRDLAKRLGAE